MSSTIIADYFEGAYGPTLKVIVRSKRDLLYIRNIFASLANQTAEINLSDLERIALGGFKTIFLKQIPDGNLGGLYMVDNTLNNPVFVWELSSLEWLECAELMDGFLIDDKPGHHYLTREGIDDAIFEVSYKEF